MGMTEGGASFQMSGKPADPKDGEDRKGWPDHVPEIGRLWKAARGATQEIRSLSKAVDLEMKENQ